MSAEERTEIQRAIAHMVTGADGGTFSLQARAQVLAAVPALAGEMSASAAAVKPDADGYVSKRFRLMSVGHFRPRVGWCAITVRADEDVLCRAAPMFGPRLDASGQMRPLQVYRDHEVETECIVGRCDDAPQWVPAAGTIPGGVENVLRFDSMADPKIARLVGEGTIFAVSAGLSFRAEQSHPEMDQETFLEMAILGAEMDGRPVALVITEIANVKEMSCVWSGADPFATDRPDVQSPMPEMPATAEASDVEGAQPEIEATAAAEPAPEIIATQAGLAPAADEEEVEMDLSEIRAALALPADATVDALAAAAGALVTSNAALLVRAEAAEVELSEMRAAEERRQTAEEIRQAIETDRKVLPADKAKLEALAAERGLDVLRASLSVIPIGASGVPVGRQLEPETRDLQGDAAPVNDSHRAQARRLLSQRMPRGQQPTEQAVEAKAAEIAEAQHKIRTGQK